MSDLFPSLCLVILRLTNSPNLQLLLPVNLHHRIYSLSLGHCCSSKCYRAPYSCQNTCLSCPHSMVSGSRSQHLGRFRGSPKPCGHCGLPTLCFLYCNWVSLFHQLDYNSLFLMGTSICFPRLHGLKVTVDTLGITHMSLLCSVRIYIFTFG